MTYQEYQLNMARAGARPLLPVLPMGVPGMVRMPGMPMPYMARPVMPPGVVRGCRTRAAVHCRAAAVPDARQHDGHGAAVSAQLAALAFIRS